MPFTEIFNALLITYVATEYSLSASASASASACSKKEKNSGFISIAKTFLSARHNQIILLIMLAVNLVDRLLLLTESGSVTAAFLKRSFERLLHAPKIMLAAVLYVVVLYIDCLRHTRTRTRTRLTLKRFVGHVGVEFVKILPLYPLLVILISCGFMFLISALEHLHLPLEWLNWPLYYGTLYGPFSLVYFQVKAKIVEEGRYFIPTSTTASSTSVITSANIDTHTDTHTHTNNTDKHQLRGLRLAHFGK